MTPPQVLPLPLHPRRAQQLFHEVLLTDSTLTPQLSEKSLPERLNQLQRENLIGIQEAKRGARFQRIRTATDSRPHTETEEVTLRLAKDGSTLQLSTETHVVSVRLLDIKGVVLHTTPLHSFSLRLDGGGTNHHESMEATDTFVASSADMLHCWMVALTCGVNAFQQQQESIFPDAKAADLVWQAVRLRIFELAGVMPFPAAIDHITGTIPDEDYQQSEALRCRVQFLQCITQVEGSR